ncbi:hypothetical protein PEBR_37738 [Penicillium brasilianum]|uniref:CCHC-type domain-containing protein n=1 Tax=Penicillium brasilianum TaxID=104259 RepID=A0A1S9RBC3_PENBI|nr:hypothetical protein PEBR_37738 [Penicillium brasilianum]
MPSNRERVLNVNHTAYDLLKELSSGQKGARPPAATPKIVNFLKQVEELTKDLLSTPLTDWQHELEALRQDLKQEIQAVKAAVEPPARQTVRSFAEAAARAPAPAHCLSHGTSSSGVRPAEVARDREVVVCLGDRSQIGTFRRLTPAELTKRANQARAKAAISTATDALATVMIVASKQLKSGDLRFTLRSAKEAEIMRVHREKWAKGLCRTAFVHMPTWGVVVHDVNIRSLGINKPSIDELRGAQDHVIKELLAANVGNWGEAEITKISWLRIPEGKKAGSLILEFTSPVPANMAIDKGALWDCNSLSVVLYDRDARVRQCFNCQQFGHIGATCANNVRCVYCAKGHQSRDCPSRDTQENKCANCEGAHAAWNAECEVRKREVERVMALARQRGRYHPVPAPYSINQPSPTLSQRSTISSWGTQQESSTVEPTSVESSGSAPGTRPSNGGQQGTGPTTTKRTTVSRTSNGIQSSRWATQNAQSATTASSGKRRGRKPKQKEPESMDTGRDEVERPTAPTFQFGEGHPHHFTTRSATGIQLGLPDVPETTAGSFLDQPATDAINFQPDTATSTSNQSKADKARARTAKAREARAKKLKEAKSASQNDMTSDIPARKQARRAAHLEKANNQAESDLSSVLDEVNMESLERQLRAGRVLTSSSLPNPGSDGDFQPSSLPEIPTRKRKQPHSDDLSLNIRSASAGKRKTHSKKLSQNKRQ